MEICIVLLLRLAWIAGTVPIIIASIPTSKLNWFRGALLGFAKRGKIMQSSSQKFTVPQRLFLHFYIVASVWTTFLLVSTSMYAYTMALSIADPYAVSTITSYLTGTSSIKSDSSKIESIYVAWLSVFLLLLMEVQVLRRLHETICVFNYRPAARMHIVGYFTGLFFYIAAPLSLCCDCALEVRDFTAKLVIAFIVKDKVHMPETELDYSLILNHLFKLGWLPWFGATIFLWGWIHQYRCHTILGLLRKRSKQIEEYVIPHGDWFELVSSAHYLSEIVIYAGLLVASGGVNLTIWLLFVFVVANLAFAAVETHKWYLKKFEDYPSNRFVIIPFVL
ncbi:polyprenol reductase 2 isoform X1 [Neltuma alba]|uniref:polyprenol reductase 2 isoform X1 n=1 Tax=Neltuma alba TaxID=207710 RepID=UPI0010A39872|nr:polyprenol reductase 2-like isoform X1 [Prosopis alba]XP_028755644.1 polyprenol reductase 2-like isoform X1 [Prosopis alba]XP_028755645.1 polyprenol reductase 2-like isoform X1 [Prosopis alba]XP_028775657.1 polyprenol reductase 2-like isoform X1 [Prosopis alba]XP_028775666.1 polyprenol reductase 2-like isoform X1 [Prosopis alba]